MDLRASRPNPPPEPLVRPAETKGRFGRRKPGRNEGGPRKVERREETATQGPECNDRYAEQPTAGDAPSHRPCILWNPDGIRTVKVSRASSSQIWQARRE